MFFNTKQRLVLLFLATCCVALALAVSMQGPRISRQVFDPQPANQRLILSFSTPIKQDTLEAELTPYTPFTIRADGRTVYVAFEEPLPLDSTINLRITATDTRNRKSTVHTSFDTPQADLFYIHRSSDDSYNDELRKTNLKDEAEQVLFSHSTILAHALTPKSHLVATSEENELQLVLLQGSRQKKLDLPLEATIRNFSGSATQERYLFTLTDTNGAQSGWEYTVKTNSWQKLIDTIGESLLGSIVLYAPDGKTIYYFDQNKNLILDNPHDDRPPSILGVFDVVSRIVPDHSALLVGKSNGFLQVQPDGTILPTPKQIQLSFQPKLLQLKNQYLYITQGLNQSGDALNQYLKKLLPDETVEVLAQEPVNTQLFLQLSLSPNDQYTVIEQAPQPVIYDSVQLNNKPKNIYSTLRSTNDGNIIRTLDGFDVLWRLES